MAASTRRDFVRKSVTAAAVGRTLVGSLAASLGGLGIASLSGCSNSGNPARVDLVWGERGLSEGRLLKPRAIAVDEEDCLQIVDMTGRIQRFTADGQYLSVIRTPATENGKPCGLGIARDGSLMVADTHYFRVLFYDRNGKQLENRTIGGQQGTGPGEFGFVTDVVEAADGCYYVSEYGEFDRIQKFSPDGEFLAQWGGHGDQPGQFMRPQALAIDAEEQLWVADACNHRIQVFQLDDMDSGPVQIFGLQGEQPGEFRYVYGLVVADDVESNSKRIFTCEFGNHRVQEFSHAGEPIRTLGRAGRGEGEFHQPWSLARDSQGRLHVLDSYNHRVQRLVM